MFYEGLPSLIAEIRQNALSTDHESLELFPTKGVGSFLLNISNKASERSLINIGMKGYYKQS